VTNLSLPSREVVRFYNTRGTAKQWITEGNQAVKMTPQFPYRVTEYTLLVRGAGWGRILGRVGRARIPYTYFCKGHVTRDTSNLMPRFNWLRAWRKAGASDE
jgi:hypothetical protein